MIVEIILNYERVGGGFDEVFLDTSKLKNYKPIGNKMPSNIVTIIENDRHLSIMAGGVDTANDILKSVGLGHLGSQKDWWFDEYQEMLKNGVVSVTRPNSIDKKFEIVYC